MFLTTHNTKISSVPSAGVLFVFTELRVSSSECAKVVSLFKHLNGRMTANTYVARLNVRAYVYLYVCIYIYVRMYVYIYVCMYIYIRMYVYIYVCMYVCVYICMYRLTEMDV